MSEKYKTLIITEKPSVARDFANALDAKNRHEGYIEGNGYVITWAVGHLLELFEPEDYDPNLKKWDMKSLPIIPTVFRYKPIAATEKQLNIIRKLLQHQNYHSIIIATDAGREGEVIARTILLDSNYSDTDKLKRFWTSQALTRQVILEGIQEVKAISEYDRLWKAGQCRQFADWLVGMNSSRAATLYWRKNYFRLQQANSSEDSSRRNDLFSVGRVQTAVLALLVDRRAERENFIPEPYWVLRAYFSNDKGCWWGTWFKDDQTRFEKESDALTVQSKIIHQTGTVELVKKQKKKEPPLPLFSLTDLQREANRLYRFTANQTLEIAQELYETKKCLSYPRTDAKVLGTKNIKMVTDLIQRFSQVYPQYFSGVDEKLIQVSNKRVFNDAKLTDHHALIPLAPLPSNATTDESRIYDLVLKRFAAAFYPDCEFEQTEIVTNVLEELFRTRGKRILKPGWKTLYQSDVLEIKSGDEEEAENLPAVSKSDPAMVSETDLQKRQTTPPPEYTEALLLKDMTHPGKYVSEDELKKIYRGDIGLGTQATRAQIIETLLERQYIERKNKYIIATNKGQQLITTLRQFPNAKILASAEETARWEMQLNNIAQGKGSDKSFINGIIEFVKRVVEEFKMNDQTIDFGKCPACGGQIVENSKGYGCSNWRQENGGCKFVIWKTIAGYTLTPEIVQQLLTEKKTGMIEGFKSKSHTIFSSSLKLVQENNEWKVVFDFSSDNSKSIGKCPACGGNVVETAKAYSCSRWRQEDGGCKFTIWKIIAQKEISKQVAAQLLDTGTTDLLMGFISKKGSAFSAKLKLINDPSTNTYKVVFDFADQP